MEQVIKVLDHLDYDSLVTQTNFEGELRRFNKFQRVVLDSIPGTEHKGANLKTYAKYILKKGANAENGS